jgi:hypothetical protein
MFYAHRAYDHSSIFSIAISLNADLWMVKWGLIMRLTVIDTTRALPMQFDGPTFHVKSIFFGFVV